MKMKLTDEQILASIRAGDDRALGQVYRHNKEAIIRYVLNNNGKEDDALDIFQEAVVLFYEKAKNVDFVLTASIGTYLFAICKNMWLKQLRSKGLVTTSDTPKDIVDITEDEDEILSNERVSAILSLLNQMIGNCKDLLSAFYYDKKSMLEIKDIFNYNTEESAKNQKYKCLKRLKELVISQNPNLK
jgi:RNA polymerase sigma factor (sigma-70 family)